MRVLVTGARTYFSLAVIRSLARAGHVVTAADSSPRSIGFWSRYTTGRFVHPSVAREPEAFVGKLRDFLRERPHDVTLPLFEEALLLSKHEGELRGLTRVPIAEHAAMMQFHDKWRLTELARSCGVPVPETRLLSRRALGAWPPEGVVLKVRQSSSARGVARVRDRRDLDGAWGALCRENDLPGDAELMVQEPVDGPQICTLGFAFRGRPKGTLVYRTICELPAEGGAGIARESIDHPAVERHAETLLERSRWHGVVGFDFMIDPRGEPKLIDANPRFSPGTLLAARAGLDLANMAVAEDEPERAGPLAVGLRTRIDPLVALWMVRSLFPNAHYMQRLRLAFTMLARNPRSRSDLFDPEDLPSLRAIPAMLVDLGTAAFDPRRRGLGYVRESQVVLRDSI